MQISVETAYLSWYTIRGSNDVGGVRNVEKWRFNALPALTYPRNYPSVTSEADRDYP